MLLGAAALAAGLTACSPTSLDGIALGCGVTAPAGASEAAQAYAAAVNASTAGWQKIDENIQVSGDTVHRSDLRLQIKTDARFVANLRAIDFPPDAAPAGAALIAAVEEYDAFLQRGYDDWDYYVSNQPEDSRLNETRAGASAHLRELLDLPPSVCIYSRP